GVPAAGGGTCAPRGRWSRGGACSRRDRRPAARRCRPATIEAMTGEPRAFLAVDHGTATAAVSLIGWVDGRWRLLGSTAAPAGVGPDPLASLLVERLRTSDPELAQTVTPRARSRDAVARYAPH